MSRTEVSDLVRLSGVLCKAGLKTLKEFSILLPNSDSPEENSYLEGAVLVIFDDAAGWRVAYIVHSLPAALDFWSKATPGGLGPWAVRQDLQRMAMAGWATELEDR